MFFSFVDELRAAGIAASMKEHLTLLEALNASVIGARPEDFYFLARATFVKDEGLLDRFDQVFGKVFKGIETSYGTEAVPIPEEWLKKVAELYLTPEQMAEIKSLGSWEEIMEALKQRLAEQQGRHQGGSKWIGTGGTSPFGNSGFNPEGVRIGGEGGQRRALKVWDKREFRNLDNSVELGTRNIKVALRRLRRFARQGAAEELDLDTTIQETASKGYLDVKLRPERRNAVKVLLFLDVGGSMDWHIEQAEELFSAARAEFKHFEHFYFHNCLYERVWKENRRRWDETTPTLDVIRTYPSDYRVVFVGDASMSPYEIVMPGGSVEHWNDEAGQVWVERLLNHFHKAVWLNPVPQKHWDYTQSIGLLRRLFGERMFPLTIEGIDGAMRELVR